MEYAAVGLGQLRGEREERCSRSGRNKSWDMLHWDLGVRMEQRREGRECVEKWGWHAGRPKGLWDLFI